MLSFPDDGGSTGSLSSRKTKAGVEGAARPVTLGEGKRKRLKRTKSRQAITPKTTVLRLAHTDKEKLFTMNKVKVINTFRRSSRLIFQIRPAAGTSRHKRSI